ncbi:MAG TPA: monovalent cation/H+ antiporter subunit D, partial [Myxococcota bacterium]|nr:monovalent cation/H+ antiporter subunit D [Myxococcota bacterium]
ARWYAVGPHFAAIFQFLLMGLNGAFLTGDLFNLFVFFEVMLAASYGLLLHGSGRARVRSGLHFIAVNLMASLLFLVGVAVLYGVTGTLNLADMAQRITVVEEADRGLLHAGAAILAVAFLVKAAAWPLGFWLTATYSAASPPAAAVFVAMTKVGVYALLRLWTLLFPAQSGPSELLGAGVLLWTGLATLAFGSVGLLASHRLARLGGYSVVVSSGTLVAALAFAEPALTAAALLYLASSTLAAGALFLLAELAERARNVMPVPTVDDAERGLPRTLEEIEAEGANLDDEEDVVVGRAIPAAMAFLGMAFIVCALLLAGLPPLSGFVAKLALLSALLAPVGRAAGTVDAGAWTLAALVVGTGLAATVAMSRAGIRHFWAPQDRPAPRLRVIEGLPIVALLAGCVALAWHGEAALGYTRAVAESLHRPGAYIDAVMSARPVPGPTRAVAGAAR